MRIIRTSLATLICATAGLSQSPDPAGMSLPDLRMVVTIDDVPAQRAPGLSPARLEVLNDSLLATLQAHKVPAVGFVNESKLYSEGSPVEDQVDLLAQWLDAGIELGNHTYSHPDLHQTPLDEFEADLLRGEKISRALAESRGVPYRYFRHPYLHTGLDLQTKISLESFLEQRGYRVAPVTIDNSEWIFARAFDNALDRGDLDSQTRLGAEYLDYMLAMTAYYEEQSRGLFDRAIPQILLIHANDLNARNLDSLLAALARRGYQFIDLESALEDPAFSSADTYVGPGGITWLHRWALTRGVEAGFFQGEPTTPGWVQDLAGFQE